MTTVVILQPQFFPWLGVFEQIYSSDIFVHLDHVQLPLGRSFVTRVQIKTPHGVQWLSAPIKRVSGQTILEAETDDAIDWRGKHMATLKAAFVHYPHRDDALDIANEAFLRGGDSISEINICAIESISSYLGLDVRFERSSQMRPSGTKDDLLLNILSRLNATKYVTGLGALDYLDHDRFESQGISVSYPTYAKRTYRQAFGEFTPFVSSLDAVAACGPDARRLLLDTTRHWSMSQHQTCQQASLR